MVFVVRLVHGLITAFFLGCIATVYYSGLTQQITAWTYVAGTCLILEGVIVALNHGDCPLGRFHHRFGDDKAFFELFLSKKLAKQAVPVLGVVAGVGLVLVVWRQALP